MKEYKIIFNPIVPIIRLTGALGFGTLSILIAILSFSTLTTETTKAILFFILGAPVFGALSYFPLKGLLKNSKIYSISNENLTVTDIIRFKTEKISKENIKGFSESEIEYRIWTFKQIIIYLTDGRKFEIMQFEHFNFGTIKTKLIDNGFHYFGFEYYHWKFFDSRIYYFD